MFNAVVEFISTQHGDSPEFIEKVRALTIGVARDREPARLHIIRIDNWFGPRWMHFAGKALGFIGLHTTRPLHVPPFVPHRVIVERVFAGPAYEETVATSPLHIDCPSSSALLRRIEDIDKEGAFVWFSCMSESQKRGAVMVYLPCDSDPTPGRRYLRTESFYMGFSERKTGWEPSMLRGVSLREVAHLQESGQAMTPEPALP